MLPPVLSNSEAPLKVLMSNLLWQKWYITETVWCRWNVHTFVAATPWQGMRPIGMGAWLPLCHEAGLLLAGMHWHEAADDIANWYCSEGTQLPVKRHCNEMPQLGL